MLTFVSSVQCTLMYAAFAARSLANFVVERNVSFLNQRRVGFSDTLSPLDVLRNEALEEYASYGDCYG